MNLFDAAGIDNMGGFQGNPGGGGTFNNGDGCSGRPMLSNNCGMPMSGGSGLVKLGGGAGGSVVEGRECVVAVAGVIMLGSGVACCGARLKPGGAVDIACGAPDAADGSEALDVPGFTAC